MDKSDVPLILPVGSSIEDGRIMFWAFDPSCSRTFVVSEDVRVDVLADMLMDFLGKEFYDNIQIRRILGSKRSAKIVEYLNTRMLSAKKRREEQLQSDAQEVS